MATNAPATPDPPDCRTRGSLDAPDDEPDDDTANSRRRVPRGTPKGAAHGEAEGDSEGTEHPQGGHEESQSRAREAAQRPQFRLRIDAPLPAGRLSLAALAAIAGAAAADIVRPQRAPWRPGVEHPGGQMPKGMQWEPHDTGARGRAAARRLRQLANRRKR